MDYKICKFTSLADQLDDIPESEEIEAFNDEVEIGISRISIDSHKVFSCKSASQRNKKISKEIRSDKNITNNLFS